MKKIALFFAVLLLTSVTASSGRKPKQGDINQSLFELKNRADTLNVKIKQYNEKD